MTHTDSGRRAICFLTLVAGMVLSACQTGQATGSPTAADPTEEPLLEVTAEFEADVTYGPGDFDLPDTRAGLDALSSYTATLTQTFDGMENGQAVHWSTTYVMVVSTEPAGRVLTIEVTMPEVTSTLLAEVDGAAYESHGENTCVANVINPDSPISARFEPAGFLNGVVGAEAAGSETLSGVTVDHYTFDERAFGMAALSKSTGEVWVASEGGYIVRYLLTVEAGPESMGEGIEGTLVEDYQLTHVNQPVAIELPEDCPGGMVDAPTLPDASNVVRLPGLLSYETATSMEDAAAFYQSEVTASGWMLNGQPLVTETLTLIEFARAGQTMAVIITPGEGSATVSISITLTR